VNGAPTVSNGAGSVQGVSFTGAGWAFDLGGDSLTVGTGGIDQTAAGLNTLSGPIVLGASSSWTIASGTLAVSSVISGVVGSGLTKDGAGTLTVSGANTYLGSTTVSAGTFFVDGNQTAATGAVNVTGGTLGGNGGIIGGNTTIGAAGTLTAGKNGIGSLTFRGDLTLSGTTSLQIASAGSFDTINLTGAGKTLSIDNTLTIDIAAGLADGTNINLLALNGNAVVGNFDTVILTGAYAGTLVNNSGTWSGVFGAQEVSFSQLNETLSVTAVPEPATLLSLSVGMGLMFWVKRTRRGRMA
jgi:autotransporter-associated beta strand protein